MKTLSGAIFGKRVKVVQEAEDIYDSICICPHCGKQVAYGDMMMVSGHSCCPVCHDSLYHEIAYDKENNYDLYLAKDYEPYGVRSPLD